MPTLKLQLVDVFRARYPGFFRTIAELLAAGAPPRDVLQHIEASGATPTLLNWCAVVVNHLSENIEEI